MKTGNDSYGEGAFQRTQLMLGAEAMRRLARSHVAVLGLGGVGGYAVEALARSGVGALTLVDSDTVSVTNLNRQLLALRSTLGRKKVDVARERVADINPDCRVTCHDMFYLPDNAHTLDLSGMDCVVDCIDTVVAKMHLARTCCDLGVPLVSCMGAAYKMDPMAFRVADFALTRVDPLARSMRKLMRRNGWDDLHFLCVYSEEKPAVPAEQPVATDGHKCPPSNAFVPAAAGLLVARTVIAQLAQL